MENSKGQPKHFFISLVLCEDSSEILFKIGSIIIIRRGIANLFGLIAVPTIDL